jgi:antitoxin (DNA-binding transcriptional repressor) of toxin-antitoxin stability system
MKASIVDLRYKMNDVIKALERHEEVTILYRGKVKGRIVPVSREENKKITDHPFFGMNKGRKESVLEELDKLRESRINDI